MISVASLFILFLFFDSIESGIVFDRGLWSKKKKISAYLLNLVLALSISYGFIAQYPLHQLFINLNLDPDNTTVIYLSSIALFVIVLTFSYAVRYAWGNIQNLLARLAFLIYCFFYIPFWAIISFSFLGIWIIAVEAKKYNWSLKELLKKDLRFR
ncbi:hypothetical protein ACFL29_01925 [Patescibacteria group bacterium]